MKKIIIFFTILIVSSGWLTGCGNSEEENHSSKTGQTRIEETSETEAADPENKVTEDSILSEAEDIRNDDTEDTSNDEAEDTSDDDTGEVSNDETESGRDMLYNTEDYGTVQESKQEFFDDKTGDVSYYFEMEKFFFYDSMPNAVLINQTLRRIYQEYENSYMEEADNYSQEESSNTPYRYWHILSIEYVGEDYISILYNDIYHMGGARSYSRLDGITIDCITGNEAAASRFLGKEDKEISAEISKTMGLDGIGTWDDIDFYLTDSAIVFFYRMPGFWEDVILQREK